MEISVKESYQQSEDLQDNLSIAVNRKASITRILIRHLLIWTRYTLERLPIKMTLSSLGIMAVALTIVMPRSVTYALLYPIFRLVFGNLYPAYASYKAVRTRNIKEYVKWMMYWIVFALFTCVETFTDVFLSFWFPFYYEIKTILVVWLLSPATRGSSILYRRFVHPILIQREAEIDEALSRATEQGYTAVLHLGSKGVNYATTVLMQTAIKGGGGLVQHLRKSYSLSDLTGEKENENRNVPLTHDETDMEVEPRRREHVGRRDYSPRRTQSSSSRVEMYFPEMDVDVRQPKSREPIASLTNIRSSGDISSGYNSGDALQSHRTTSQGDSLVRTSSVGARTRVKPRSTTKKTPEDAGEESDCIDLPPSTNIIPSPLSLVTPEQALEILLLLSQNSNVNDYLKFDREFPVVSNDQLGNTSQSGPKTAENDDKAVESGPSFMENELNVNIQTIESIEVKAVPDNLSTSKDADKIVHLCTDKSAEETKSETKTKSETEKDAVATSLNEASSANLEESAKSTHCTITDEICQNKFDELKQLLSDAHKAVNSIVNSQEKLRNSDTAIDVLQDNVETPSVAETESKEESTESKEENKTHLKYAAQNEGINETEKSENKDAATNQDNTATLEVWATPNLSRSNSDSLGRAGKYNKKPAPKVPPTGSEEDLDDTESQSALKATLVIKTGTLKTFSNTSATKDVFLAHAPDGKSKGKKSRRQRTKEGFSKLLTIPKNIFHSAFHKEHKDSGKAEDSNSEISASDSRSNSIESQDVFVELAPKIPNQEINVENVSLHATNNDNVSNISITIEHSPVSTSDINESNADKAFADVDESVKTLTKDTQDSGEDIQQNLDNSKSLIRRMSESPKMAKKIITDV